MKFLVFDFYKVGPNHMVNCLAALLMVICHAVEKPYTQVRPVLQAEMNVFCV
jgi:hypothetical protein